MSGRSALIRLLVVSASWAAGSTAMVALQLRGLRDLAAFALATGAYWLTRDLGRRRRRGELKYWRGRPVDDRWS